MTRSSRLLTVLLDTACGTPPEAPAPRTGPDGPRDFTIAVQANVHGDIEPCG